MLELVRLFRHKGLIGASTVTAGLFITFNEYVTLHVVLAILFQFFTHLLVYPAGWVYAKQWCQLFGEKSVFAMFAMVTVQKTLLFPVLLPLLQVPNFGYYTSNMVLIVTSYIVAFSLIGFGAWLQSHVYRKLGRDGVYYGFKFGKSIPWVSDFPFDTFRHPQYTGAYSICLGLYIILGPSIPVLLIGSAQAWGYIFTSFMESSSDQDSQVEVEKEIKQE